MCVSLHFVRTFADEKAVSAMGAAFGTHHENAHSHTSPFAVAKINELYFELLRHAPYSPYLALTDFFLFPNMKKCLSGRRFSLNAEVIVETNALKNNRLLF